MDKVIAEGDYVVLMKSFDSGNMKFVPAVRNTTIHYGKLHFDPSPLIGAEYGQVFEINDGSMFRVDNFETFDEELSTVVTDKLLTFNDKSQFSKEKILKKKKKKNHANVVTLMRPNLILINEMLFARDKLGGLRLDSLSQMITSANIQNGSKCMVLDHNLGLLTSAIMSRILPDGLCVQLVPDNEHIVTTRKTLSMLNLNQDTLSKKLIALSVQDLYKIHKNIDDFSHEIDIKRARFLDHLNKLTSNNSQTRTVVDEETNKKFKVELNEAERQNLRETLMKKEANRELRDSERVQAAIYLKQRTMDSLIIVAQHDHPLPILKYAYDFLAPSRQFVIYSDSVEPLVECHQHLKTQSLAVSLSLSETWFRRYQVLPDRTRPEMNTSGYGGYLLSGIKALIGPPPDTSGDVGMVD